MSKTIVTSELPGQEGRSADAVPQQKTYFSLWSALGVQYSLTASPLAMGVYLSLAIGLGGSPFYIWGFILVGLVQLFYCLALAEIASAMPHSSGPAYWAVALTSPQYSSAVGYVTGWISNCAWICVVAASCLYCAQLTMALATICYADYTIEVWHTYLVYLAYALIFLFFNLPGLFTCLKFLLPATIIIINGTCLFIFTTLLVRAKPKAPAKEVFITIVNESGWPDGVAFLVALLPGLSALSGFDNASHLTDQIEHPSKQVPQVMIGSYLMSFAIAISMIIIYQFCNVDPVALLKPVGGQPFIQLMANAYQSTALTVTGTVLLIICFCFSGCSALVTTSRLYWSFSHNGTLPFSKLTRHTVTKQELPVNAALWITLVVCLLGAISLGSTTALNALLGAPVLCGLVIGCYIIWLALHKGRDHLDSGRWLNLGKIGTAIYWVSFAWSLVVSIFLCLPLYIPVTASAMNYAAAVVAGFVVLSVIYWFFIFSRNTAR